MRLGKGRSNLICSNSIKKFKKPRRIIASWHSILILVTLSYRIPCTTSFSTSIRPAVSKIATTTKLAFGSTQIHPLLTSSTSTSIHMISNFLGGGKGDGAASSTLPKDVKEAVSKCRAAVQEALGKKQSRMEVNFPVGTKFGVESNRSRKKKSKKTLIINDDTEGGEDMPTKADFDTSDRELALLFVEMFQAVGGDAISVVFRDATLAQIAKTKWKGDVGAECKVLSVDRKTAKKGGAGKKKKKKAMGFAAKMAEEFDESNINAGPFRLPDGCEVALFVSPGPKELIAVKRICEDVGMGTLVVLLNARLTDFDTSDEAVESSADDDTNFFQQEFETVFHLSAVPQEEAPGCLIYHAFPEGWILARKPKVGPPKTFASFQTQPTGEECRVAYEGIEIGDLEKGVEDALDNVAGWFS